MFIVVTIPIPTANIINIVSGKVWVSIVCWWQSVYRQAKGNHQYAHTSLKGKRLSVHLRTQFERINQCPSRWQHKRFLTFQSASSTVKTEYGMKRNSCSRGTWLLAM